MTTPPPIAEYEVCFDHAYYRGAMRERQPLRHALGRVGYAFLALSILLFVLMCAIAITDGEWWKVGVAGVPFAAFLVYLRRREPRDLDRLRSVVEYRAVMRILVTAAGIELVGPDSSLILRWSVFARAKTGPRGILLVHGDGSAAWLPDSGRTSGSRTDVDPVVATHVAAATDR